MLSDSIQNHYQWSYFYCIMPFYIQFFYQWPNVCWGLFLEVAICIIVFIYCYIEMNKDSLYCDGVLWCKRKMHEYLLQTKAMEFERATKSKLEHLSLNHFHKNLIEVNTKWLHLLLHFGGGSYFSKSLRVQKQVTPLK